MSYETYRREVSGWRSLVDAELVDFPAPPQALPMLGLYDGPFGESGPTGWAGGWPDLATTYYQGNQRIDQTKERLRIDRGTDPLITITTKASGLTWTQVGSGEADTWLNQYVADLNTLQTYAASKGRQVWATIDHEAEVKVNQNLVPGETSDVPYPPMFNRWANKMVTNAPGVKRLYWYGYFDTASIEYIGSNIDVDLVDLFTLDPYSTDSHSSAETFEQTVGGHVSWLRGRSWFPANGKIALSEFGTATTHGDAACAAWLTDLRTHMANLGLEWGVFFNRNNPNYKIDGGSFPLSVAAFRASLAAGRD